VRITRRGIAFRPLTPAQADRLARHLEDLENGVRVMVPPFIESGEEIIVNTEDFSYVSRAKSSS
jgi:elongation factor P